MASPQTLGVPTITGDTVEEIRESAQFWLQEAFRHLDRITGLRDEPKIYQNLNANGNRVTSLGVPTTPTDAQRVDHCLHTDAVGGDFDANGVSIVNLKAAEDASEAVNLSQIRSEIITALISDTSFLKADGTIQLTANWDAGSFEIRAQTFQSDVATGTAPIIVASTTVVTNLNADTVDGVEAASMVQITGVQTAAGAKTWSDAAVFSSSLEIDGDLDHDGSNAGFFTAAPAGQVAAEADVSTTHNITDPADTPATADALRDDLVANTIPSIESALNAHGTTINALIDFAQAHGLMAT